MLVRFLHIVASSCSLFILIINTPILWICHFLFIYSILAEDLGSFQVGAFMNRPAMNILVHVCLHFFYGFALYREQYKYNRIKKLATHFDSINYLGLNNKSFQRRFYLIEN